MTETPAAPLPMPTEGGSYTRNKDGTLTRVAATTEETPEAPPVETPTKASKRPAKEG